MIRRTALTRPVVFLLLACAVPCVHADDGSAESAQLVSSTTITLRAAAADSAERSVWAPIGWACAGGAVIGSVAPGLGTVVGCVVGGGGAALWRWLR